MKTYLVKFAALTLIPAATLLLISCSSPYKGTEQSTTVETADGAIAVDTFTTTGTVYAIDASKREIKLIMPDGRKTSYKAGPDVVNFDQLQIGDHVTAVLTEQVAVSLGSGASPTGTSGTGVALAPVGGKPGGVMVETTETTGKVIAVDANKRKVTFVLPDGTITTVKAGKQVDISAVRIGDDVTVQLGEGLAITVEKS
jgi:hypothetical protein